MSSHIGVEKLKESIRGQTPLDFQVSGISIQYAVVCKRELWFYLHGVDINRDNPHIATGSAVDSQFYKDAQTEVIHGMIAPDILEDGRIVEVKPSSNKTDGPKMQLLYYIWFFKEIFGEEKEGVLAYPQERKREPVSLTKDNEEDVKNLIDTIWEIYSQKSPPPFEQKPVCSSCAYKDFCQVGGNYE